MYAETQFSIFMVNKPGVLAQVLTGFADDKINITALTMVDSVEHGVMRVVAAAPAKVRKTLSRLNMPYEETEVLCVTLANKAGAFANLTQRLAKAHINISYAYCTSGARGGKTTAILKVANIKQAMKVLQEHADAGTKSKPKVRRSLSTRK